MKLTHITLWFKGRCVENVPAWEDEYGNIFFKRDITERLMDIWLEWPKNRWAVRFDVVSQPTAQAADDEDQEQSQSNFSRTAAEM